MQIFKGKAKIALKYVLIPHGYSFILTAKALSGQA